MTGEIIISIDLMKIHGAQLVRSERSGTLALVINLPQSTAQVAHLEGRETDRAPEAIIQLKAYPSKKLKGEQTHWVNEPAARPRLSPEQQLPFVGTVRVFE